MSDDIKNIISGLQALEGTHSVSDEERFSNAFLFEKTKYPSWQSMKDAAGVQIDTPEWEEFVKANTPFHSWQEMIEVADDYWVEEQVNAIL